MGLCSYLLIGFYYDRPSAVAAAKKAFIVNRIGDFGFAIGIFLTYTTFGTVEISAILSQADDVRDATAAHHWIPFLLMLGAFGKSAQLPLYVWLPDAMEGPTPVSALIHAATMVTAGVYMIARLFPLFELSPYALPTVATIGGLTALFAAAIATCQVDLKRVFAYSTISQLGYMFLALGVGSTTGAIFHLVTHAFFKALLFLTAGSVMHAMAGQLDMRKISGLRRRMPITCGLMFVGCLALAGFPFITSGFYSKDTIIADVMSHAHEHHSWWTWSLAALALVTAGLTAYYTFRLWCRVFLGPETYEMGEEHHEAHTSDDTDDGIQVEHHQEPHEMGWLMNGPLIVLAIGALGGGALGAWVAGSVAGSSAATETHHGGQAWWLGMGAHGWAATLSGVVGIGGICVALFYHWMNRPAATAIAAARPRLVAALRNKLYVDEFYAATVVAPLRTTAELFFVIDRMLIDGLVALIGLVPRLGGLTLQPLQRGSLQGYGLGMATGAAALIFLVLVIYEAVQTIP